MNHTSRLLLTAVIGTLAAAQAMAAPVAATASETRAEAAARAEAESLAPTALDMKKARQARERGVVPPRNNDKTTRIETVRDKDNRVTEYVVTPGSTHIPYTMENRSEKPISTNPSSNPNSTLGTSKFLRFGW